MVTHGVATQAQFALGGRARPKTGMAPQYGREEVDGVDVRQGAADLPPTRGRADESTMTAELVMRIPRYGIWSARSHAECAVHADGLAIDVVVLDQLGDQQGEVRGLG